MVIVDINNDYCDDLCYSYQLCQADDGTYFVWMETGILRGRYLGKDFASFNDAWACLNEGIREHEDLGVTL